MFDLIVASDLLFWIVCAICSRNALVLIWGVLLLSFHGCCVLLVWCGYFNCLLLGFGVWLICLVWLIGVVWCLLIDCVMVMPLV